MIARPFMRSTLLIAVALATPHTARAACLATEICRNGVDDDCDSHIDNCIMHPRRADAVLEGKPYDAMGATVDVADLNADGVADLITGAPISNATVEIRSRTYVHFGPLSGTVVAGTAGMTIFPTADALYIGRSLSAGDANADAIDDVLVGDWYGDAAYLFLGPLTVDRSTRDADASYYLHGPGDILGYEVEVVSDVDGDEMHDVVVTDPWAWNVAGSAYVVSGALTGAMSPRHSATYVYEGQRAGNEVALNAVDIGDTDGDGLSELAMQTSSMAYIVPGGLSPGQYSLGGVAIAAIGVGRMPDFAIWSGDLANLVSVDFDRDGYDDIVTGRSGIAYGYLGPLWNGHHTTRDADVSWYGDSIGDWIQTGDVNGDGNADFLFGGKSSYLSYGPASGSVDVTTLLTFPSDTFNSVPGAGLAFIPDWDGDGGDEVAVAGEVGREHAGAVYVFYSDWFY